MTSFEELMATLYSFVAQQKVAPWESTHICGDRIRCSCFDAFELWVQSTQRADLWSVSWAVGCLHRNPQLV